MTPGRRVAAFTLCAALLLPSRTTLAQAVAPCIAQYTTLAPTEPAARLELAHCLLDLGLTHAALTVYDAVLETDPAAALDLVRLLPRIEEHVAREYLTVRFQRFSLEQLATVPEPMRSRAYYLSALGALGEGQFESAIARASRVTRGSGSYVPAMIVTATIHVRLHAGDPAERTLRAVTADDTRADPMLAATVLLDLARLYYQAHEYDRAIATWARVDAHGPFARVATFEQAWGYFARGDLSRTIENLDRVDRGTPADVPSEANVLRALALFRLCRDEEALAVLARFDHSVSAMLTALRATIASAGGDNEGRHRFAAAFYRDPTTIPEPLRGLLRDALGDRVVRRHLDEVTAVAAELDRFRALPTSFRESPIGSDLLQDLTMQQAFAIDLTGDVVDGRLLRAVDELEELRHQALGIRVEILERRRTGVERPVRH